MRDKLKRAIAFCTRTSLAVGRRERETHRDVNIATHWILEGIDKNELNDVLAYVSLVRECIEPMRVSTKTVKAPTDDTNQAGKRFNAFLKLLSAKLPPLHPKLITRIAKISDEYYHANHLAWAGKMPVHYHFSASSSAGRKGRLLTTAVKFFRPERIAELGTAYGISSLFMGATLQTLGPRTSPAIHTLEGYEPQATLSREILNREFSGLIRCVHGTTQTHIPALLEGAGPIDFVFHDAGHTHDDFVNDFKALEPHLARGAVVIFDDIRWEDRRFTSGPTGAHDGWLAVVGHSRVERAAELDNEIGLLLLS